MNRFNSAKARRLRERAGLRLIDLAIEAGCAPSTVRSYEFGVPVRPDIERRLVAAYRRLCGRRRSHG